MKRRFIVDASKKIKAAIIPYNLPSTSDLINNERLDERFGYDLPNIIDLDINGIATKAFTVDSEVVLMSEYDPWVEEENDLGDPPTCIRYTVLVPIYETMLDEHADISSLSNPIDAQLNAFLDSEIGGSDYCWIVIPRSCNQHLVSHITELYGEQYSDNAIGYYLVHIVIMPICP